MSNVAINRETGEILVLSPEGQWQPAQRARNPETGAELYSDGNQWLPIPQPPQPAPTTGESLARGAGLAARALGPMAAGAAMGAAAGAPLAGVGAIPGAIAGATAAGLAQPIADLAVSAWNAATGGRRPLPSQATEQLMTAAGLPVPQPGAERVASTALRAGAEAMTGVGAARQIAAALPTPSVGRGVAETLATAPGMQTAAATTGATVTQGLLDADVPAAVAVPVGVGASMLPAVRPQNVLPRRDAALRDENIRRLTEAGVPLTPAQDLGNPFASAAESVMKYLPTTAPRVARVEDEQMRAFTRNIMRQAGIDSDIASPEVLSRARRDFRQQYTNLEARTPFRGDEQLFSDLANIEQNYVRGFQEVMPAWERMRDTVLDYAAGRRGDGVDYHRIQSRISEELARATRSSAPSASFWAQALQGLQRSLGNAMERSAPDDSIRTAWNDVNRRYALFSRIEDTMARAGQDKLNTGFIPPQQIAAVEQARRPQQWVEGGDPFTDFVRAGAAILPNPTPNSGTAQRTFAQDLLTGARRGAPVAAAGGAAQAAGLSLIDPALALGLPYGVSRLWYGRPLDLQTQGLLGMQSLYGATQARE